MGVSTNAMLVFGLQLEENKTYPWDNYEECCYGELGSWYYDKIKPFVDLPESSFDEHGNWKGGEETPELRAMCDNRWKAEQAHMKANPIPVMIETHCSGDSPMYILTVPGINKSAGRGYPESIEAEDLRVDVIHIETILQFCITHGIDADTENLRWWLCSYWG